MSSPYRIVTAISIAYGSALITVAASVLPDDLPYVTSYNGHQKISRREIWSFILRCGHQPTHGLSPTRALQRLGRSPCGVQWQERHFFIFAVQMNSRYRGFLLPEAVADSYRKDRKETGIAEVMVVARLESDETLLEARVLIDGFAAN